MYRSHLDARRRRWQVCDEDQTPLVNYALQRSVLCQVQVVSVLDTDREWLICRAGWGGGR
jgi:hypothetical protein